MKRPILAGHSMEPYIMNGRPLYNSRVIGTYIKLIKKQYGYVNVGELLAYAKMPDYEVADQGHWFTQDQFNLFYEKLVRMTGNENIAREAGQYAASPDALGVMRHYALGLVRPSSTFALLMQATENFVKSSMYESRIIASDKVEIIVTPNDEVHEKPFQCENRIGFFEAVVRMFSYNIREIAHPECMFKGGKVCRYIISWENTHSALWKKIKNYAFLSVLVTNLISFLMSPLVTLTIIFPVTVCLALLTSVIALYLEKEELKVAIDDVRDSTDKLLEQTGANYNNALITNEIGQVISKQTDVDKILSNVIQVLENRLDYDRGMILLTNDDKTRLIYRTGFGYTDIQANYLKKASFHLDRPESKGVFIVSFREQRPFLINDFNVIESSLSAHSLVFARKLGTQSFICCPIICEGESLGILAVDNMETKKPLIESDMSLLMGIAPVIGISIHNANLIEARVCQFSSILQVMAASIDARDNLTAGHSERVTEFALGICDELGLSQEYREMIRVASLLHDYGKIGVPDSILKKPGRLTAEEHDIVKSHSAKSREILEQINFEGIFSQVPEIAGSHHEKVDGTGYPNGLKGREIPLGAKIIAVADFFEAITAKRHYRDPMPLDVAIGLLQDKIGTHFEKKIVNALITYLNKAKVCFLDESLRWLQVGESVRTRVPCNIPVFVQKDGLTMPGSSVDISIRGIYIAIDIDVQEGNEIELSFAIPDNYSTFCNTKGRVAWVNSKKERRKPSMPVGFGVEFIETTASREAVQAFVDSCVPVDWLCDGKKSAYDNAC